MTSALSYGLCYKREVNTKIKIALAKAKGHILMRILIRFHNFIQVSSTAIDCQDFKA